MTPTRVDLPRDHKRYCKSKGIGWPYMVNSPKHNPRGPEAATGEGHAFPLRAQ